MERFMAAAIEINTLWRQCIDGQKIHPDECPCNEQIAEIIERHFEDQPQRNQTETEKSHD